MGNRKKRSKITLQKLERSRRIVMLCMRLSRKKVRDEYVNLIAAHVVANLPAPMMRRLVKGDCGTPMLAVMKLTAPYFA